MGSSQSRLPSASSNPTINISTDNLTTLNSNDHESDDEFIECTDDFEKLDLNSTKIVSNDDEIVKISKPLESLPKSCGDDGTIPSVSSQTEVFCSKQIDSDDDDGESSEDRKERQRKEMDEFREEMNKRREMRQQCIKKLREELIDLREKLSSEMETNEQLRETLEQHGVNKSMSELAEENKQLKADLAECQMFLQTSNSENINSTMESQALKDHVRSLKEVIKATKEMLNIRECQVDQMKAKLTEIEATFAEKEMKIMSSALQQEYHRQLENIRNMRELYEERANLLTQEKNTLKLQLDEKEADLKTEIEKSKNLEEYIGTLENNVKLKNIDISQLESEIGLLKSEKSQVLSEMNAVNQLISQVLFGFNASGNSIDIDKLVSMLEQNRDLLNEMAIKEDYAGIDEGYFLPKLLYEIFIQANKNANGENQETSNESIEESKQSSSPEEIAEKLPKVWRVLIELLSHHKKLVDEEERELVDCYKSVQTATGPQNVISVSKTFIKLKDLILEKRSLQKDTNRLKTLYSHLEQRLDKQEKRLSNVSLELTKTWHIVGKIKRQHRSLATQEMMIHYQLQQKRRVLNELKAELEYCRKKWALARALNNDSEEQCKLLRQEFSLRKIQDQNSAESGYSDEHPSDDDDGAGPSQNAIKADKFDENLVQFDRTASPVNLERRHSESQLIEDFNELNRTTRAQSEPSLVYEIYTEPNIANEEYDEILDLIPEPLQMPCVATSSLELEEDENDARNMLTVSPPPEIYEYDKKNLPKIKTHLRKHRKEKKRKHNKNQAESAEEMYMRLLASMHDDCSTCSTFTTTEEDDPDSENIEEIQEIPMDQPSCSTSNSQLDSEHEKLIIEPCNSECLEVNDAECIESVPEDVPSSNDPQPSTSTPVDDFTLLTLPEQEYLQKREARLARLEAEAKEFYDRMARNREKGQQLSKHMNDVHNNFLERQKDKAKSENIESEPSNDEPSTSSNSSSDAEKKADEPDTNNDEKT